GLQLIVAAGANARDTITKETKGKAFQHRGELTWGMGGFISAEQPDLAVAVVTQEPAGTQRLSAAESYRVGIAVLQWLRAHLDQVATDVRPPTCSETPQPDTTPAGVQLEQAQIAYTRARVPI